MMGKNMNKSPHKIHGILDHEDVTKINGALSAKDRASFDDRCDLTSEADKNFDKNSSHGGIKVYKK